ncbi:hypothetical protein ACNUDN_05998 [Mycobacterium sp. smrl_JER01]
MSNTWGQGPTSGHRTLKLIGLTQREHASGGGFAGADGMFGALAVFDGAANGSLENGFAPIGSLPGGPPLHP